MNATEWKWSVPEASFLKVKTSVFSLANKIAGFFSFTSMEYELEKLEWSWAGVEWSLYSNSSALLGNMDHWCLDYFLYYFQWGIRHIWNSWAVCFLLKDTSINMNCLAVLNSYSHVIRQDSHIKYELNAFTSIYKCSHIGYRKKVKTFFVSLNRLLKEIITK